MIVLPSVNAGTRSSYGIQKKFNSSYGYSFNYGYNISYYLPDYDPALAYFYSYVYLYYLKVDNKIINNNSLNYIFSQDDTLDNSYYRNDGYGLGPVGCIDQLNYYLKNIYKINDFTFYPAAGGVVLKSSIGRKMILTISSYVYTEYDGSVVEGGRYINWTLYINYPYSSTDPTASMVEMTDVVDPFFNGYTSYFDNMGYFNWG